jgi:hypothetical protein
LSGEKRKRGESSRKQDIISHIIQSKASVKISQDLIKSSLNKIHLRYSLILNTFSIITSFFEILE